ncbi:MAG: M28 family peptidase, partial [Flavobacteriales bacterium]
AIISQNEEITSTNVLGFIEGTDPELKKEVIIITAHYDHLGIKDGLVYNGADDDGTGTVALLEIAEAFQKAKNEGNGVKRSILIMPVSGEEKGLLGSSYYSDNPIYPIANTVVDLNIDMIGRLDENHKKPDYVYLIGADKISKELHDISEATNETYIGLNLDYTFNDENDPNRFYYRSDHYNFAKKGIPVIFYFSGVHEDYHKATDEIDKIMFDKVETITRLVFHTAWEIANKKERLKIDEK